MNNINLNNEWQNKKNPIVNGIIYSDGSIESIDVNYCGDKREIIFGNKIYLNDLLSNNELGFSNIVINKKIQNSDKQINVYCGEGSFGGDGFILVENQSNSLIKWCAFFEESNPFENIEIIEDKIIAYNNLNEKWIFDINDPTKIFIDSVAIN